MWSDDDEYGYGYGYGYGNGYDQYDYDDDTYDLFGRLTISRATRTTGRKLTITPKPVNNDDHFESGSYKFTKIILSWSVTELFKSKIKIPGLEVLPDDYEIYSDREKALYYSSFKPLILEDARAVLKQGLQLVNDKKAPTVHTTLSRKAFLSRNDDNPCYFTTKLKLPREIDYGRSRLLVLLHSKTNYKVRLLGLGSEELGNEHSNTSKMKFKFIADDDLRDYNSECFEKGAKWRIHFLGSVLSHERMYEVCTVQPEVNFLPQLVRGRLLNIPAQDARGDLLRFPSKQNRRGVVAPLQKLNHSQQQALDAFNRLNDGLLLLQGPPGTGKTTTIVEIIQSQFEQNKRVLVCAPSNKAVQVIAKRFLKNYPAVPQVVAGVEAKLDPELRPIFLHILKKNVFEKIEKLKRLVRSPGVYVTQNNVSRLEASDIDKLYNQEFKSYFLYVPTRYHHSIRNLINMAKNYAYDLEIILSENLHALRVMLKDNSAHSSRLSGQYLRLKNQYEQFLRAVTQLIAQITQDKNYEDDVLNAAKVIFSTLCVVGRDHMKKTRNVDVLIVDEAGQCVEAENLIPMILQPKKCLLVGDTKQLPATVISQKARKLGYDRSLMWRLIEDCKQHHMMLTIQYRMHPAIRQWPSKQFYRDKLQDARQIAQRKSRAQDLYKHQVLGPCSFIDTTGNESSKDSSYENKKEASLVVEIIKYLFRFAQFDIGVISFYAAQVILIDQLLRKNNIKGVRVHTVDGFQGDENDIIIISFVRSNQRQKVGFLSDFRRLNVAITRAKHSLIMLGNTDTLRGTDKNLKSLILHQERNNALFEEQQLMRLIIPKNLTKLGAAEKPAPTQRRTKSKPKSKTGKQTKSSVRKRSPAKSTKKAVKPKPYKYKTEQCRFFEKGNCRKGNSCTYAHGNVDKLKQMYSK